jgi:hypothetical protein
MQFCYPGVLHTKDVAEPLTESCMLELTDMARNMGYASTSVHLNYLYIMGRVAIAFVAVRSILLANGGATTKLHVAGGITKLHVTDDRAQKVLKLQTVIADMKGFIKDFDASPPTDPYLDGACTLNAKVLYEDSSNIMADLGSAWGSDLDKLAGMLTKFMPEHFNEVKLDTIFDDDNMIEAIVLNRNAARLHKAHEMMTGYISSCKMLRAAGIHHD